jgi:glycosyltransferase involved in cell wall biosynthesis
VSDVYAHKNLSIALRVLADVRRAGFPTMSLAVAGALEDQAEADRLKALALELGIAHSVRFLGRVERPQLRDLYNAADVMLVPSLAESFGMPLLEALRCGVPVVCSDLPAFREVAGEAGLYFDPQDAQQAKDGVLRALAMPRPFQAGIEHASRYTWETAARLTLKVLVPDAVPLKATLSSAERQTS